MIYKAPTSIKNQGALGILLTRASNAGRVGRNRDSDRFANPNTVQRPNRYSV